MKKFGLVILVLFLFSCGKDNAGGKPTLKVKGISTNYIPKDDPLLLVTLEYSAPDGDIAGLPITFEKKSSSDTLCPDPSYVDSSGAFYSFPLTLPPTDNQKGEMTLKFTVNQLKRDQCNGIDTLEEAVFKFWFRDGAGNVSDTAVTEPITIEK